MGNRPNVKGKTHQVVNHPFLYFMPSHLKLVKEVIALGWERYGGQFRIWGVTHFFENVFLASWESKCWEIPPQAIIHPCISFLTQLEIAGAFSLKFLLFSFIFPMDGNLIWAMLSGWDPPWAFLVWISSLT